MRVRVKVEQHHIDGASHTSTNCPLARALSERLGAMVSVGVRTWGVMEEEARIQALGRSAQRIVKRFDSHQPIAPCALFMDIPEEVLRAHHA